MEKIIVVISILLCSSLFAMNDFFDTEQHQEDVDEAVVFIHGLFGFKDIFVGVSYWGQLPTSAEKQGKKVYVAKLSQAHDIAVLGDQLYQLLMKWGHKKYHLVGHSLGGIVARYVEEQDPNLIATVTTICSPHRGSKMADLFYTVINGLPFVSNIAWNMGNVVCHAIGAFSWSFRRQDLKKAVYCLTTKQMEKFNEDFSRGLSSNVDGKFYSFGTCVSMPKHIFDLWTMSFWVSGLVLYGTPNDGIVEEKSMKYGDWLGSCDAYHILPVEKGIGRYNKNLITQFETKCIEHVKQLKSLAPVSVLQ